MPSWMPPAIRQVPYPWVVVGLAACAQGASNLVNHGLPALYPFLQVDLNLTRAQVGLITSALSGAGIFTVFLGGWLADVWGVRRVVGASLIVAALTTMALALGSSLVVILAFAVLAGMARSPAYPASSRAVIDWVAPRVRGVAMAVKQTSVPLAGMVPALVLPTIAVVAGWQVAVIVLGAMVLMGVCVFLLFYRERPGVSLAQRWPSRGELRGLVARRAMWPPLFWGTFMASFQFIVPTYLVLYLVEEVRMSPVAAGAFLAIAQAGALGGIIVWGGISDVVFRGRRAPALGLLGVMAAACFVGLRLSDAATPAPLLALITLGLGATALAWHGVFTVYIGEAAGPGRSGTALGISDTVVRIGTIVSPPLFGLLVDVTGSYASGWTVSAAAALGSTAVLVLLGREGRRSAGA